MCQILLPIKEKYSNAILSNEKTFEIRRKAPNRVFNSILIYTTAPISKIVGEARVCKIHKLPLKDLWKLTEGKNELTKKEFYNYFEGQDYGYAYEINKTKKFSKPISLDHYGIKSAPQHFKYID